MGDRYCLAIYNKALLRTNFPLRFNFARATGAIPVVPKQKFKNMEYDK